MLPTVVTYATLFVVIAALLALVVVSLTSGRPSFDVVGLVDSVGDAMETFSDTGTIMVRGEIWKAATKRGIVQRGDKVRVVEIGPELTLVVEKVG